MTLTGRQGAQTVRHAEEVMGTVVSFDVRVDGPCGVEELLAEACRRLHEADALFSTWKPQSPVSAWRRGELATSDLPPAVAEVLARCEEAKRASRGWFDPWAMPGGVDPTGLVKGWAAELALAALEAPGVRSALVNAGGDVAAFGSPAPGEPWRVGIRHPWRPDALACVVHVASAVATSGPYERGAHLVDPFRGAPVARAASATVTGPSLWLADALATALAVGGDAAFDALEALDGYEAYLVRPDGTERASAQMPFASGG